MKGFGCSAVGNENRKRIGFEQVIVEQHHRSISVTKYTFFNQSRNATQKILQICKLPPYMQVIEHFTNGSRLTLKSELKGTKKETILLQPVSQPTLCCWLLQILLLNYCALHNSIHLQFDYLDPSVVYADSARLYLLPPNLSSPKIDSGVVIRKFYSRIFCSSQPSQAFQALINEVVESNLNSQSTLNQLIDKVKNHQFPLTRSIQKLRYNHRRYIRQVSQEKSQEINKEFKKFRSQENLLRIYHLKENQLASGRTKTDSKNISIKELAQQKKLRKIGKSIFLEKRLQNRIQSQNFIKAPEPESGNKTQRTNQQTLASTKPQSIQKLFARRKSNRYENKLIIRDPFYKRELKQKLNNINESIIQTNKYEEVVESTDGLRSLIRQINQKLG